jgi:hypothetical protein
MNPRIDIIPRNLSEGALLIVILVGIACAMLSGCANLKDKSVAFGGTVSAVKIETSGSASTGTPTPSVLMGGAAYAFADSPSNDNRPVFVRAARSSFLSQIFGLGLDDSATIYIGTSGESPEATAARMKAFATDTDRF